MQHLAVPIVCVSPILYSTSVFRDISFDSILPLFCYLCTNGTVFIYTFNV